MSGVIEIGLTANIQNCSSIHQQMMDMIGAHDVVTLDASQVEVIDLTFLQLVHALRSLAATQGKQVVLSAPANQHLSAAVTRAGLVSAEAQPGDDFWFQGGHPQ